MSESKFAPADILRVLDDAVEPSYLFPILDNMSYYYGASRLTVFRGSAEWLVTFSEVLFSIPMQAFVTDIFAVGNRMPREGFVNGTRIIEPSQRSPWTLEDGSFGVDLFDFSIRIRGKERSFRPTAKAYKNMGIGPRSKMKPEARVLRYLVEKVNGELHATVAEILKAIRRTASKLKVLVSTSEYHHPRLSDELPSDTVSFKSLAKAIAANDASLFLPGKSNTHWKNWTDFESF